MTTIEGGSDRGVSPCQIFEGGSGGLRRPNASWAEIVFEVIGAQSTSTRECQNPKVQKWFWKIIFGRCNFLRYCRRKRTIFGGPTKSVRFHVTRCVMDLSIYVHYPVDRPTDPKSHFLDHFVAKIVGCWVRWSPKHGGMPFLDTLSLFPKVPTHMESSPRTKRAKT